MLPPGAPWYVKLYLSSKRPFQWKLLIHQFQKNCHENAASLTNSLNYEKISLDFLHGVVSQLTSKETRLCASIGRGTYQVSIFGNPESVGGRLLAKIPTFCIPKSLAGWLDAWESPLKLRIHSRFPKMLSEAGTHYRLPRPSFFRSKKLVVSSDKLVLPNNLGSQFPPGFCSSAC